MKYYFLFLITFVLALPAYANKNKPFLNELDALIAERNQYTQVKQKRINVLTDLHRRSNFDDDRYSSALRLFSENLAYNVDSAFFYAQEAVKYSKKAGGEKEIFAKLKLIQSYILLGIYSEASIQLTQIRGSIQTEAMLKEYYIIAAVLYQNMQLYSSYSVLSEKYKALAGEYKDSLLQINESEKYNYPTIYAERLRDKGETDKGITLLKKEVKKYTPDDRMFAYIYSTLADLYKSQGKTEEQTKALIFSAKSDILCGVKENTALRELAVLLYQAGQLNRAYRYIRIALDDALYSKAKLRSYEVMQILPIIDKAYSEMAARKQRFKMLLLSFGAILTFFLFLLLYFLYRQRNALKFANRQVKEKNEELNKSLKQLDVNHKELKKLNSQLSKENELQEAHIIKYLKLSYSYICKINNYRTFLHKKAIKVSKEELIKTLKSDEFIETELSEFYHEFDFAFLSLHPDFISKFNALLKENERYSLKENELLNPELRIFALIRLGINDSNQIADFLRYSLTTIYNYRTRVRNKSKIPREQFEDRVKTL